MAWRIEFEHSAERDLERLSQPTIKRILRFMRERVASLDNPRAIGEPLRGAWRGFWKYRVGDYRIIVEIEDEHVRIVVIKLGNRREIYRR